MTVIKGRMADPNVADEFMTSALGAQLLGVRLGQTVPFGRFSPAEANQAGFGTPAIQPRIRLPMRLVAIVEFNDQVIADDTDRTPTNVVLTPALTRSIPLEQSNGTWYAIRLKPGIRDVGSVEQQLISVLPPGSSANFNSSAVTEQKVETALRPESIVLGVFGLIAVLGRWGFACR